MTKRGHFGTRLCLNAEKNAAMGKQALAGAKRRGSGTYLQWREIRFDVVLRVCLEGLSLSTSNISMTGMQVVCPAGHFDALPSEFGARQLTATLFLDAEHEVRCTCSVVYVTDSGDEYLIGMEFQEFEGPGQETLRDFLPTQSVSERAEERCVITRNGLR